MLFKMSERIERKEGWSTFLSRERKISNGKIFKRVSGKFVKESQELLGLQHCKSVETPSVRENETHEPGEPLEAQEATVYRQVVGKLLHVQEDYIGTANHYFFVETHVLSV